jgi:hypothetical protein
LTQRATKPGHVPGFVVCWCGESEVLSSIFLFVLLPIEETADSFAALRNDNLGCE